VLVFSLLSGSATTGGIIRHEGCEGNARTKTAYEVQEAKVMTDRPKLLAERWETPDGQRRLKALTEAAREGREWAPILDGFPFADEYRVRNGRDLRYANLAGYDLKNANLQGVHAEKLCLTWANLREASLTGADLGFADFTGCNLSNSNLDRADMRFASMAEVDLRDATAVGTRFHSADLTFALMPRANLVGSDFISAKLEGADLTEALLVATNFGNALLREVDMSGADLTRANFQYSDLSWARLVEANLFLADIRFACMYRADLTDARNQWTLDPPVWAESSDVVTVSPAPSIRASDAEMRRQISSAESALFRHCVEEHLAGMRCECRGAWTVEQHRYREAMAHYDDRAYDIVQCHCRQCGQKQQFIYDVTQVLERFVMRDTDDWNADRDI
jgi:uncharacterized protein YjbI with pentapeptide repeats